jgi:hypothetical protein
VWPKYIRELISTIKTAYENLLDIFHLIKKMHGTTVKVMTRSCLGAPERRQEDVRRNVDKGYEILNSELGKNGTLFSG